ncbi:MAG: Pr6Pr family membrane protein [Lachnospiraceae bacterium]|nr:Pr6Pr family membrane protein [Lachnospiraceae bacterium]
MKQISTFRKCLSYILKTVVFLSAVIGTFLSAYAGRMTFMGGKTVFMYFTIQSNIAIAIISAIGCFLLWQRKVPSKVWYVIKFVGTVAITLTGVVFVVVLAPTLGVHAWNVQNILTHVVVPVAAAVDFFVTVSGVNIGKRNVIYVIIPPILYAIYAGIGYVLGWEFAAGVNYPYFFLNWGSEAGAFGFSSELPFMGSAWWILVLLVFLIAVGYCYLMVADRIGRRIGSGKKSSR